MNTRVIPLLPDAWDETITDAVSAFPSGRDFILDNWKEGGARGMNGVGALLNHPKLAKAFLTFNNHIAKDNSLSKRHSEMLILRVSWLRQSEYEYQQHVILGLRAGLTEKEISNIQAGPVRDLWEAEDCVLLAAADQLIENANIESDTWNELSRYYDANQIMDLVFTVGCYEVLAMAFKSFDVSFESCLERMAPDVKERMYQPSECSK